MTLMRKTWKMSISPVQQIFPEFFKGRLSAWNLHQESGTGLEWQKSTMLRKIRQQRLEPSRVKLWCTRIGIVCSNNFHLKIVFCLVLQKINLGFDKQFYPGRKKTLFMRKSLYEGSYFWINLTWSSWSISDGPNTNTRFFQQKDVWVH